MDLSFEHTQERFLDEVSQTGLNAELTENVEYQDSVRRISDPIHKFIELPKSIWRIVDTPEFQRLRFIKQLGATCFVFNGANHTRFEHCLGVAHLASKYMDTIAKNHSQRYTELGLRDEEHFNQLKLLVTIAGLCHDLGHGPYSHMFDNMLLPKLGENVWKHEQGSCSMLQGLLEDEQNEFKTNPIQYKTASFIIEKHFEIVQDMIQGLHLKEWESKYKENKEYPRWCFDIISNKTSTIDVDKFDYLKRDPSGLNIKHEYDWEMLFLETRIIQGEICYNSKLHDQVYDLFHIRYKLYKQIYLHRVTQGIELMMCDAFVLAAEICPFQEIIKSHSEYLKLTDSILQTILYNPDPRLEQSQLLINRILRRDLYRFVGEVILEQKIHINEEQIIDGISRHSQNSFGFKGKLTRLTQEEVKQIVVKISKVNYCKGEHDPVDNVRFFRSSNPHEKRKLPPLNSSLLRPQRFGEQIVRVFVKNSDDIPLINKIKSGFANFTRDELKKEQSDYDKKDIAKISTPLKESAEKRLKQDQIQSVLQVNNSSAEKSTFQRNIFQ